MTNQKLLNSLSKLGFPMFEPSEELDVNETLAEVVASSDTRLWEGFPVLLANAAESYQFSPDLVSEQLTSKEQEEGRLGLHVGRGLSALVAPLPWPSECIVLPMLHPSLLPRRARSRRMPGS